MDEDSAQPGGRDHGPGADPGSDGDFIAWAMEGSEPARKLVIAPIVAGLLAALVATSLKFDAGLPVFMSSIPWSLLSGYQCFVLPKHLVFFCLIAAPAASALILLTQPRLRRPADGDAPVSPAPPITERQRGITMVGIAAVVVMVLAFHLFAGGWWLACRLENAVGIIARYLLSAVIVALAPAASIAALALAYSHRERFAVSWVPEAARAAMQPVGMMTAIIALLTIDYAIVTHDGRAGHPIATNLFYMACGFLVARGSLAVARLMGWLSAAMIVMAVVDVLTAPLRTPPGLILAKFRTAPVENALTAVMVLVWFGFALWIYQAVRAKPILEARAAAHRTTSPPWTGFGCGLLLVAYAIGSHVLLEARLGKEARILAREKYGKAYSFHITGYGYGGGYGGRGGDHVFVTLEGYNDHEVFDGQVDWKQ